MLHQNQVKKFRWWFTKLKFGDFVNASPKSSSEISLMIHQIQVRRFRRCFTKFKFEGFVNALSNSSLEDLLMLHQFERFTDASPKSSAKDLSMLHQIQVRFAWLWKIKSNLLGRLHFICEIKFGLRLQCSSRDSASSGWCDSPSSPRFKSWLWLKWFAWLYPNSKVQV